MTNPITPPPELVQQWASEFYGATIAPGEASTAIANQAARWGADQELEACLAEVSFFGTRALAGKIRAARRHKPPSLKDQALAALAAADGADHPVVCTVITADQHAIIRRALETLDD